MENSAVVAQEHREVSTPRAESVMAVVARAAADPSVDVAKMEALIALQIKVMAMEAKSHYDAAMARLQPKLPIIVKDRKGAHGKYASIDQIDARIGPLLTEEGFHFTFRSDPQPDKTTLIVGVLHHKGGHDSVPATIPMPLDTTKGQNAAQGAVGAVSYGIRALKRMMLDLRMEDEDKDGDSTKTVTVDQALTLQAMVDQIEEFRPGYREASKTRLFAAMGGVADYASIPSARFSEAVNKLKLAQAGPQK